MAEPWLVSGSIETEINGVPVALPVAGAEVRYGRSEDVRREWHGYTPAAVIYDELAEPPIPEMVGRILAELLRPEYRRPCGPPWVHELTGDGWPADWPFMSWCGYAFIPAVLDVEPRLVDVALGPERYAPLPPFVAWSYRVWLTIEEARR